ncbi:MAG: hypothetical protein EXS05_12405 [Planctomycetaceae bacterium]|nr:hypothetical protein [Planctomycetaceae bacterium]
MGNLVTGIAIGITCTVLAWLGKWIFLSPVIEAVFRHDEFGKVQIRKEEITQIPSGERIRTITETVATIPGFFTLRERGAGF